MKIYEATANTDSTEGRGIMALMGYFTNIEAAVECVQGMGVMGQGTGTVYEIEVQDTFTGHPKTGTPWINKFQVYGHRPNRMGVWGFGYNDNRDNPDFTKDPNTRNLKD